jgi:hypothetical protein
MMITIDKLRSDLAEVLNVYGLEVEAFLASDIDEHPSGILRDVWLMVKDVIPQAEHLNGSGL